MRFYNIISGASTERFVNDDFLGPVNMDMPELVGMRVHRVLGSHLVNSNRFLVMQKRSRANLHEKTTVTCHFKGNKVSFFFFFP